VLQCVAWDKEPHFCGDLFNLHSVVVCSSVLQRVAARCSVLQRVAARCRKLYRVAARCIVLHRVAVCCSVSRISVGVVSSTFVGSSSSMTPLTHLYM